MKNPDWTTYVPRRVYDTARTLETACERANLSPIGEVEWRMTHWPTKSGRAFWGEVWRFLMEEYCIGSEYRYEIVVIDDPGFERVVTVLPQQLH
ncbi:hypothetical protein ACFPOD_01665 [Nitratireductor kimnyeongensis]|uniref:Uncharacterized protein n=1 Tax=Nitratireductor kimnyeongensis TaxID=430679 RepID=A0ABW0T3N3_9HYPH|nr:hypothetical protein [Nitratireductor kimnyeongensis]QZZ35161.1 hypothetical protein KW403_15530 [Nitratireductor kimnyeongensis]